MERKIGISGKFGPRYGKRIRKVVAEIEKEKREKHLCPKCKMPYVKRLAKGIWYCKKCKIKFAGSAYYPLK
jgi:large subunit ribosomal protein L37Ae